MNDAFSDALGEVFREVVDFHDTLRTRKIPSLDETHRRFVKRIDAFADKGRSQPGRTADFELARCALVYWIDEMLTLHFGWEHAEDFRAICLELHYPELKTLKDRSPGERDRPVEGPYRFYEMAEVARTSEETDPLEAFLLCATLGFRGKFDMREEELMEWVKQTHDRLRPRLLKQDRASSLDRDGPGPVETPLKRLRGQHLLLGISTLTAVTAIVTLIGFLVAVHSQPY